MTKYYPDVFVTDNHVTVSVLKLKEIKPGIYETEHGNILRFKAVFDTPEEAHGAGVLRLFQMSAAIKKYLMKGE